MPAIPHIGFKGAKKAQADRTERDCIFTDMKYFFFLSITLLLSVSGRTQSDTDIQQWANQTDLLSAQTGFLAIDAETGERLAGFQENKAMIPASLLKLFTTIAALESAGPDQKFKTVLAYRGSVDPVGVLHGDLILTGQGDPSLGSAHLNLDPKAVVQRMASSLSSAGITKVNGSFIVDESGFLPVIPGTWSWEDLTNYYAAIPHAVNYMDNEFTITFETFEAGKPARIVSVAPEIPGLKLTSQIVSANISGDQSYCFGHPLQNEITVQGMLPQNRKSFRVRGAIPQPGQFLAAQIIDAAKIEVRGEIMVNHQSEASLQPKTELLTLWSPPLKELIKPVNTRSVNLYAEALANIFAVESYQHSVGSDWLQSYWEKRLGNSTAGLNIKDGSGLSHFNTVTPTQLIEVLKAGYSGTHRESFMESLPVAGRSGTLVRFGAGSVLEGNLRAKSGYMTGSRGYAGFMKLQSGRTAALVILVNHYSISASLMRQRMEQLLIEFQQNN